MTINCLSSGLTRLASLVVAALLPAIVAWPHSAHAQALDIDQPEITQGEREVKSVNVLNGRYPPGTAGVPRNSHELNTAYSPTDWFKVTAHVDLENMLVEGWRADHVGFETQFKLIEAGKSGGFALGWFSSVQLSTDPLSTNSLFFGPIIKFSSQRVALTVNTYLEDQFGRNSTPSMNFYYAWQGRLEVSKGIAIGVESFGKIDNLSDASPWREQDHRIGPALFLSWERREGRNVALDLSLLAGLTEAAPDLSLKANLATTF